MDVRHVVAEGTDDTGVSWVIWARRDAPREGDLLSMIRLTDAGGRIIHVGASSGPPLYPGRLLNVTTNGSEEGPRALLGRVDPTVRRLELRVHDGGTRNVPLYDCAQVPEVRFAALLLPRQELLDSGITVPTRSRPDIELEEMDGDEVVVRISATPQTASDGAKLADEILASIARTAREGNGGSPAPSAPAPAASTRHDDL